MPRENLNPYTIAQSQFSRFYPTAYGRGTSGASMSADSLQRWMHSLQALQTTISMQAQSAQNLAQIRFIRPSGPPDPGLLAQPRLKSRILRICLIF